MPEPIDIYSMQPLGPEAEQMRQNITQEVGRKLAEGGAGGGTNLDAVGAAVEMVGNVVDVASAAGDVGGAIMETVASSAEVCGHVVSGACEALGSAGDLLGALDGCGSCGGAIAFLIVLATAGSALAVTLF